MIVKEKLIEHLERYHTPKTAFARGCGISYSALNRYLRGDLELSRKTENKILLYICSVEK